MDLRRVRYFVAVAESLHFGQAAAKLGITQPGLSQQVQRLEHELGVVLLERSSRRTALTEAGTALLDPLQRCLAAYDEAVGLARTSSEQPGHEPLRIGIPCLEASAFLQPMLRRVVHRFPDTRIELAESSCGREPTMIHEGAVDAGFVHLPIELSELGTLVVHRDELVVLLPRNHPCVHDERVDLRKLADEPFIEFKARCPAYTLELKRVIRRSGIVPQIEYGSSGLTGVFEMVAMRLGIAIVPGSAVTGDITGVVARRLTPASKELDLAFVWSRSRASGAVHRLRQLMDELVHQHSDSPVPVVGSRVSHAA
jgi:DNA-binding transcriptional LysR family regulator